MDIVYQKKVLIVSFQDFWCTKINNHQICFENDDNKVFETQNSLHTTRIYSFAFKYVFFSFSKKSDAKIYNNYILNY